MQQKDELYSDSKGIVERIFLAILLYFLKDIGHDNFSYSLLPFFLPLILHLSTTYNVAILLYFLLFSNDAISNFEFMQQ